jgi:predicted glycosyltransferase
VIWIDITNLPHVLFFRDFIKKNDCLVTTRDFGNLTSLLDQNNIEYVVVGRHGGKEQKAQLLESSRRVEELTKIVSENDVETALAKHSVELPRVAYGLDIQSIFVLDNEHAEQQNRLTLPLISTLVTPEALDKRIILRQGADSKKIRTFYGVCESGNIKLFRPDKESVKEFGDYVVVRSEPYMAAYFRSEGQTQTLIDKLDSLGYNVIVLPRGGERFKNAVHLENIDALNLIYHAKGFFGGGGTMNREAAILGVPAISFYSQELLGVDRFLMKIGLMYHTATLDIDIEEVISDKGLKKKAKRIRESFQDPFEVIKDAAQEVRN